MNEDDKKGSHIYDGIEEDNNPLPKWWLYTFYLTLLFAVSYYGYYQLGTGPSLAKEYETHLKAFEAQHPADNQKDDISESALEEMVKDSKNLEAGKQVFMVRCIACHGPSGGGGIGPNLTDNFWIHGNGKTAAILEVVKNGVLTKGMPAWDAILSKDEKRQVALYVRSLRGTKPTNPKAPQGEEHKE